MSEMILALSLTPRYFLLSIFVLSAKTFVFFILKKNACRFYEDVLQYHLLYLSHRI